MFTGNDVTASDWIAGVARRTSANGDVIGHTAVSVAATSAWTRILTLEVPARLRR